MDVLRRLEAEVETVATPAGLSIASYAEGGGEYAVAVDALLYEAVEPHIVLPEDLFRDVEAVLTDPDEPEMDREFFAKTLSRYRENVGL